MHYLLNQWIDFDHTCIDTLLGGGEELIRFWRPGMETLGKKLCPHGPGHITKMIAMHIYCKTH